MPPSTSAAAPIHALFSCAGVADGTPGIERINFIGHRHMIDRLLAQEMLPSGSAIGFISSAAGLGWLENLEELNEYLDTPDFDSAVRWVEDHGKADYMSTKQAICAYVARQAYPLLERGIRINAICPGPTDTPLAQANKDLWLGFGSDYRESVGIEAATPLEQAYPLVFLCSDAARMLSGTTLITDSGYISSGLTGSFPPATPVAELLDRPTGSDDRPETGQRTTSRRLVGTERHQGATDGFRADRRPAGAARRRSLCSVQTPALPRSFARSSRRRKATRSRMTGSLWRQMVDLDWPALTIPEIVRRSRAWLRRAGDRGEELGRSVAPSPFLATLTQFAPMIREAGSPEQQRQVSPARLPNRAAPAHSDWPRIPAAGKRPVWRPPLAQTDDGWVLDGRKAFVLDGVTAAEIAVVARLEGPKGPDGLGVFVVPTDCGGGNGR